MKKKNKTKDIIIIMVILTVVISAILVAVNIVSSKYDESSQDVTSKREWAEVSDNIKYMVQSSDLQVKYIASDKRIVIFLIGSENYYGLRYTESANALYLLQGTYTSAATTDALKISEATDEINGSGGSFVKYADNVTSFVVEGAGANGLFPDGTVNVTLTVEVGGKMTREKFAAAIPQTEE